MKRITLAALAGVAVIVTGPAYAQQQVDWEKIQIKTTDSREPKPIVWKGQGGNITVCDRHRRHPHGGHPGSRHSAIRSRPAIKAISPLPIKERDPDPLSTATTPAAWQTSRRNGVYRHRAGQYPSAPARRPPPMATTGNKTAPLSGDAIPKQTFVGGLDDGRGGVAARRS